MDQLYDTLYGLLRNHLDGFVDIPEKVDRVRFSRRFLRLKQIHAQRCLKIGITTEPELLAKEDDTYSSWIDILQSCNFYPATKTEWADVKQGVIEVEQNALLGDDVQTLLDDLQADIAG